MEIPSAGHILGHPLSPQISEGINGQSEISESPKNLFGVSRRLCHPRQHPQGTVLVTLVVSLGRCCGGRSRRAQKAKTEMKGSESARLASICNRAWRGLLGLKRRFHPFPRCCNVSPAGFHLPLIDTQGSNERDGKSGSGRRWGGHKPLCKGFKTLSVCQLMRGSGEGSWSCAKWCWEDGAPRSLLVCAHLGHG